jgi:hypothetical protein
LTASHHLSLTTIGHPVPATDPSSRLAGAALLVVGLLNLATAVLALTTDVVRLSAGAAGGSMAVGLALVAVGVLVWRGNRAATIGAFAVVLALLLLQVGQIVTDAGDAAAAAASADEPLARLAVLAVLAAALVVAAWRRRRPATRHDAPEAVPAGR